MMVLFLNGNLCFQFQPRPFRALHHASSVQSDLSDAGMGGAADLQPYRAGRVGW